MSHERTLAAMSGGGHMFGEFSLPDLSDSENVQGLLRWDDNRGADLELLNPTESWGADTLARKITVFGLLADGTLITLPGAWVSGYSHSAMFVSRLRSDTVLLGTNTSSTAEWHSMSFCPAHLHEWHSVTGIAKPVWDFDDRGMTRHLVVEWKPEDAIVIDLPEAQLSISPTMQTETSFSPENSIRTAMKVHIKPHNPSTIEDLERLYLRPIMAFTTIVATRWDTPTLETVFEPADKELVRVLHAGHTVKSRDWRPGDGRYLFLADDCTDLTDLFKRWFALYDEIGLPIRAFGETYREGNSYSQGRLIALVTALDGYCVAKFNFSKGSFLDKFKALRDYAGLPAELMGCRDDQLALVWRARNYFTHLGAKGGYSPTQLERSIIECCRIAAALMQGCLLRDLGFSTEQSIDLFERHYRSWPLPTAKIEPDDADLG